MCMFCYILVPWHLLFACIWLNHQMPTVGGWRGAWLITCISLVRRASLLDPLWKGGSFFCFKGFMIEIWEDPQFRIKNAQFLVLEWCRLLQFSLLFHRFTNKTITTLSFGSYVCTNILLVINRSGWFDFCCDWFGTSNSSRQEGRFPRKYVS